MIWDRSLWKRVSAAAVVTLLVCGALSAIESGNTRYRLSGRTPAAAGGVNSSGARRLTSIVGQPGPVGRCAGSQHTLQSGFQLPDVMRRLLQFALEPGWNLKGAPGATARTTDEVFRGAAGAPVKVGNIRYWNAESQEYAEGNDADPLVGGWGFWVFSYWGGKSREFAFAAEDRFPWEDELRPGWNLYSPPFQVTVPGGTDLLVVWKWNAALGSYELVYPGQNLVAGEGYWILRQER
jgi:hypothetical protein